MFRFHEQKENGIPRTIFGFQNKRPRQNEGKKLDLINMETINLHKYLRLSALVNSICAAIGISLVG
jgi:hypothetical protein